MRVGLTTVAVILASATLALLLGLGSRAPGETETSLGAARTDAVGASQGTVAAGGPANANPPRGTTGANLDGRCTFSLGQQVAFEVTFDKTLEISAAISSVKGRGRTPSPDRAQQVIRTTVRARVDGLVVAVVGTDSALMAVRLSDMTHTPALTGAVDSVQSDVQKPYLLRVTRSCRVADSARLTGSSLLAHEQIINIFGAFDFEADSRAAGARYAASHRDAYGAHTATYEVLGGAGRGGLHRRRLRYTVAPTGFGPLDVDVTVRASDATMRLGASPWLESLNETFTLVLEQKTGTQIVDTSATEIRAVPVDPSSKSALALPVSGYQWGRPTADALDAERAQLLSTDLRGVPLDDLLTRVRDILAARGNLGMHEGQQLLRAWLVQNPEGATAMATAMRTDELTDSTKADLALALAKAGTPEGLAALKDIAFDGAATENVRAQSASALGDAMSPTLETVSTLEALATSEAGKSTYGLVASTASMALGSLAADNGGAVGEQALQAIGRQLDGSDSGSRMLAFYAAGNSGDSRFLGAVQKELDQSDDPIMRAAAIRATRLMPPNQVEELLMTALAKEADSEVQKAIVDAQGSQQHLLGQPASLELVALYKSQLPSAVAAVRAEMIAVLGTSARLRPEAEAVLLWWYPQEPVTGLKVAIGGYVNVGAAASRGE